MTLLTKKNVVRLIIAVIWLYNCLLIFDITGIRKFSNLTFQAITITFPVLYLLFVKAKPPEPDFIPTVKVLATSIAIGTILTLIKP
ncbi:hypothetical protein [Pyrococcus sp. NA2]|uniref:hypothetical protein n=1 Tax=Pyrococcus sp. (strain NA2) TaxID=342949 RepID=UPI00064E8868|nr:hypothetical protein [Pyrococcus sp. NA2]